MRKLKCNKCGKAFYTMEAYKAACQNCDGSVFNSDQAQKEADTVRQLNSATKSDEKQTVDIRKTTKRKPGRPKKTQEGDDAASS